MSFGVRYVLRVGGTSRWLPSLDDMGNESHAAKDGLPTMKSFGYWMRRSTPGAAAWIGGKKDYVAPELQSASSRVEIIAPETSLRYRRRR